MGFKENLKSLRQDNNMSQERLAKELNISRQAISKWESGKAYPDIDNLILLRKIFNITIDELVIDENIEEYESVNQEGRVFNDTVDNANECDEDDETSVNLILGGFIIGTAIGLLTENFMWGTALAFIGLGIGYILEAIKGKEKMKES